MNHSVEKKITRLQTDLDFLYVTFTVTKHLKDMSVPVKSCCEWRMKSSKWSSTLSGSDKEGVNETETASRWKFVRCGGVNGSSSEVCLWQFKSGVENWGCRLGCWSLLGCWGGFDVIIASTLSSFASWLAKEHSSRSTIVRSSPSSVTASW